MPISRRTLTRFRDHLVTHSVVREIQNDFAAVGIQAKTNHEPSVSGERRYVIEQHYASVDLRNPQHERRLLEFFEEVLFRAESEERDRLVAYLVRDGFQYVDGRVLVPIHRQHLASLLAKGRASRFAHLQQHVDRILASVDEDPGQAIGSAKELLESSCKTILSERELPVESGWDLPQVVKAASKALCLLPEDVNQAAKGAKTIKRTLSNLGSVAQGIAELRNLYGTGHGRDGQWRGVHPRHARLAVGAAATLATFLLETHWCSREEGSG